MPAKMTNCRSCKERRPHKAKGLCNNCYQTDYRTERGSGAPVRTTRGSEGLAAILTARGGPTAREVEYWVARGYLRPDITPGVGGRASWSWPLAEQRVAVAMGRLVAAGLRPEKAEQVARHPRGGPVVLGPGVVISLFNLPSAAAVTADVDGAAVAS